MSSTIALAEAPPLWRNARRQRILAATLGLLRRHTLEDVSMDDIARASGCGKATLYRYFDTKEALLGACLDDVVARLSERLESAEAAAEAPPQRLVAIVATMVDSFSTDLLPLRLLTRRDHDLHAAWRRTVKDARARLVAVLRQNLESGMALGLYRPIDPVMVAHLVMGMIRSGVTHVEECPPAKLGPAIHDFILRGCGSAPSP